MPRKSGDGWLGGSGVIMTAKPQHAQKRDRLPARWTRIGVSNERDSDGDLTGAQGGMARAPQLQLRETAGRSIAYFLALSSFQTKLRGRTVDRATEIDRPASFLR